MNKPRVVIAAVAVVVAATANAHAQTRVLSPGGERPPRPPLLEAGDWGLALMGPETRALFYEEEVRVRSETLDPKGLETVRQPFLSLFVMFRGESLSSPVPEKFIVVGISGEPVLILPMRKVEEEKTHNDLGETGIRYSADAEVPLAKVLGALKPDNALVLVFTNGDRVTYKTQWQALTIK
jgi:hypothetical protein